MIVTSLFVLIASSWNFNGYSMIEEEQEVTLDQITNEITKDITENIADTPFTVKKDDFNKFGKRTDIVQLLGGILTSNFTGEDDIYGYALKMPVKKTFFRLCHHALSVIVLRKYKNEWSKESEPVKWLNNVTYNLLLFGEGNELVGFLRFFEPFLLKQELEKRNIDQDTDILISLHNTGYYLLKAIMNGYKARWNSFTEEEKAKNQDVMVHSMACFNAFMQVAGLDSTKLPDKLNQQIQEYTSHFVEDTTRFISIKKFPDTQSVAYIATQLLYMPIESILMSVYLQPYYDNFFENIKEKIVKLVFLFWPGVEKISTSEDIFTLSGVQKTIHFISHINAKQKEGQDQSNLHRSLIYVMDTINKENLAQQVGVKKVKCINKLIALAIGTTISIREAEINLVSENTRKTFVDLLGIIKEHASDNQITIVSNKIIEVAGNSRDNIAYFRECLIQAGFDMSVTREYVIEKLVERPSSFSRIKTWAEKHPFHFAGVAVLGLSSIIGLILAIKYKKMRLPT